MRVGGKKSWNSETGIKVCFRFDGESKFWPCWTFYGLWQVPPSKGSVFCCGGISTGCPQVGDKPMSLSPPPVAGIVNVWLTLIDAAALKHVNKKNIAYSV